MYFANKQNDLLITNPKKGSLCKVVRRSILHTLCSALMKILQRNAKASKHFQPTDGATFVTKWSYAVLPRHIIFQSGCDQ